MKQLLVGLSIIVLVSVLLSFSGTGSTGEKRSQIIFDSIDAKKEYPVKMLVVNWDRYYQGLTIAANELRQSDRPSKNVAFIIDSVIGPLQQQIASQLQQQFKDAEKKPK